MDLRIFVSISWFNGSNVFFSTISVPRNIKNSVLGLGFFWVVDLNLPNSSTHTHTHKLLIYWANMIITEQ
jgi:hypothetical protein